MSNAPRNGLRGLVASMHLLVPWKHQYLIKQLARRDVLARYKGSVLGLAWGLLFPLMILMAYTFV
ncbi:MAG: hypothetical protein H7293_09875, partial [Candidatus Saccharibacteria bacterium]|nr:hypothetical protein [Rhodoferax sp.]